MNRFLLFLLPFYLAAQAPTVSIYPGPPTTAFQIINGYTGSNLTSRCWAESSESTSSRLQLTSSITAATNANPAVLTSAAHGFNTNSRPLVTIKGAIGMWTPINGTFTATIVDANTFSIPVNSTGFSTLTGTITFTSTAPRINQPWWAVLIYSYDASSNLVWQGWLNGSSGFQAKCSDATSSSTNIQ